MPGWPSVGRADDQRLLEALRRADSRAADGLYDTYADRLNDYARSLLHDTDAAADSVHDAIVIGHGRPDVLREPGRLRAWLYALTRFECTARRGRTPAHGMTPEPPLEGDEEDPELAAIVRESLAELGQKERDILLLAVRHELSTSEIGAVIGLNSRQTGSRLTRARDHLENAAAAVVLARTGRAHCPDLSALLDSIEGPLPQQLRRRLTRHIIGCEECTEGRHRRVSAERLLDTIPVAFPPLSLRRRVAESCARPAGDQARAAIMTVTGVFDKNGFPPVGAERRAKGDRRGADRGTPTEQMETPRYGVAGADRYGTGAPHGATPRHGVRAVSQETLRQEITAAHGEAGLPPATGDGGQGGHGTPPRREYGRGDTGGHGTPARREYGRGEAGRRGGRGLRKASRRSTPVFATIACVLVATGAMVVATGQDASKPGGTTQTLQFPTRTPGELEISYGPEPTDAPPSSDPPPKPSPTATPKKAPTPAGGGSQGPAASSAVPRPRPSRTPTRAAPAPAAKLVVSCPGGLDEDGAGVILVSARNATVSWTASATGGLAVSPGQGVLRTGVKVRLSIAADEPGEAGQGTVTLRSTTGSSTCQVSWEAQDPPPASDPPPDDQPTSDPTASGTPSEESDAESS
ncbi:RNA polymerase sigma factor [Sphaerisporangium corydalis]|uniref:RNA polymerase sigma factor n=1 Tax=Sphaerisporangium corydalis TaxID=1441875 RepID=A0ABV9E9G9_9ACTN|nr:sigma-70 family RNA polymerase sigma factor [Sphaerisporangium corydalis]